MGFISKQPNGRYCKFSTVVDCPTHWNMTAEEYLQMCAEKGRAEGKLTLEYCLRPFDEIKERFIPNNMTEEEFANFLKDASEEVRDDEPKYNPVEMAYRIIRDEHINAQKDLANYQVSFAAIEEALGYLGEALDDNA